MKTKIKIFRFLLTLKKSLTKNKILYIFIIFLCCHNIFSQELIPFGLDGIKVNDINYFGGYLYAGTDTGVFKRYLENPDSVWIHIGLENKKVNAVYPHFVDAVSWTITTGISPEFTPDDSALIYCLDIANNTWVITDTGIDRNIINKINSVDGFPSPTICGETLAVGGGKLYRRGISSWYEAVFDIEGEVNVVKINLRDNDVWIGGETGFFGPFIATSSNKGDDWSVSYPDLFGDNRCYDLEFDRIDTNVVYAALRGAVIKSTNGGVTWNPTGLVNLSYTFYSLKNLRFPDLLFAGGSNAADEIMLFYTNDGGNNWNQVQSNSYKGITSMTIVPTPIPELNYLYIGTSGNGVFWLSSITPVLNDKNNSINDFILSQNYPNPFNPTTRIKYSIPNVISTEGRNLTVTLKVYDVLGREVATLVNEEKQPGVYEVEFNAAGLASGVYYYQLKSGSHIETKKMIYLK